MRSRLGYLAELLVITLAVLMGALYVSAYYTPVAILALPAVFVGLTAVARPEAVASRRFLRGYLHVSAAFSIAALVSQIALICSVGLRG